MLSAVANDPWAAMFTRNAPRNTPGQSLYPDNKIVAKAIPLGGHTAEALGWTRAKDKPKLPAQK
jgi:hypothetical protein